MKAWSPLTLGLAAGALALAASTGTLAYRKWRRPKDPAELERQRRLRLTRQGRIITGEIVDVVEAQGPTALLLVYRYDVAGVTYEVAQDVSRLLDVQALAGRPMGGTLSVKYEMRQPGNSIVISEEWSGLPEVQADGNIPEGRADASQSCG